MLTNPSGKIRPTLIAITDHDRLAKAELLVRAQWLCEHAAAGTVMIQLRDHALSVRERRELGQQLRDLTRETGQWFVVNDRLDLVRVLGADGVHLGEASVLVADARVLLGPERWISSAWHEPSLLPLTDADAYLLSPIIIARKGRPALGLDVLRKARDAFDKTNQGACLYALGGVDEHSAAACIRAGAHGVALIGAAFSGPLPAPLLDVLEITRV